MSLKTLIKLSICETITDINKAIKSHENILKGNSSERVKQPYRDRLYKIKELTKTN